MKEKRNHNINSSYFYVDVGKLNLSQSCRVLLNKEYLICAIKDEIAQTS